MRYCSAEGFEARFGKSELVQLTDADRDGQPDNEVLAVAAEDTAAEIDSWIGQRYPLPLPTVPAALVRVAHDMLRYRLYGHSAPEEVRNRYRDALEWLKAVAAGRASLGVPLPEQPAVDQVAVVKARPAVFTPALLGRRPQ